MSRANKKKKEIFIPSTIFLDRSLSVLETIVEYLKEKKEAYIPMAKAGGFTPSLIKDRAKRL